MIGEIRQNFTEASASVGLILATALQNSQKHEQHEAEQLNHKLRGRARAGDFDLTGKCD